MRRPAEEVALTRPGPESDGQQPGHEDGSRPTQPPRPRLQAYAPLRVEAAAVRRGAPDADIVVTGMGPVRAQAAVRSREDDRGPAVVLGFAGAVASGSSAGDLVVASEVRGPHGTRLLPCAPVVAQALRRAGMVVHTGPIVSVDHVVRGSERDRLAATGRSEGSPVGGGPEHGAGSTGEPVVGPLAVDMESAWLAAGLSPERPLAVVRALVDTPDHGLASPASLVGGVRAFRSLVRAAAVLEEWAGATVTPGYPRRVLLAGPRSFCAGVERAIEIVERALEKFGPPVYVRKQIVHNIHVVRGLESRGAAFVDELDEVPAGATVVFSAHGVAPAVRQAAEAKQLHVVDATCPLVAKVHAETRRFSRKGYRIMLIGHAGHEEVEGTMGEAPDAVHLVERSEDIASVPVDDPDRVAYLTQTTLATDEVADVVAELRSRFPHLAGPAADDICYATQNRQEAVRALAGHCDVLLVVGSPNSSNSNRLVEVANRQGCPAHLLDDAGELDLAWLAGAATVGVTAGASAPESMVDGVVAALATLGPIDVSHRSVTTESVQFPLPTEVR